MDDLITRGLATRGPRGNGAVTVGRYRGNQSTLIKTESIGQGEKIYADIEIRRSAEFSRGKGFLALFPRWSLHRNYFSLDGYHPKAMPLGFGGKVPGAIYRFHRSTEVVPHLFPLQSPATPSDWSYTPGMKTFYDTTKRV